MDLGIAGRKAIVCASSRGLGKACARALAEAGCEVVINGRDAKRLEATADEIAQRDRRQGHRRSPPTSPRPRASRRCSPPARSPTSWSTTMPARRCAISASSTRQQMIDGVIANMVVAIELMQKVIDPMSERKFGRIVNITSGSVKMPLAGLDLSSGARAGLTAFLAGVARTVRRKNVTINNHPARRRSIPTGCAACSSNDGEAARASDVEQVAAERMATIPARRFGEPDEFGAACAFLCSAHAGYITGQNLLIDGGTFNGAF